MLQKVLQAILRRYFGQFLTGLQNVQLGFWAGKINIQNASFKHDKINQLIKQNNLPFSIKFSYIGSLQIDIPWNKLSSSAVQVIITDIFIVLKLQQISFHNINNLSQNSKLLFIKNYTEYLIKKSMEMKIQSNNNSGSGENSYLNRLIIKVLHNMNVKIKNISIRVESDGVGASGYSNFNMNTSNKEQKQQQNQQKTNTQNTHNHHQFSQKIQRKASTISNLSSSQYTKKSKFSSSSSAKPFALGLCIQQFIAFTADQTGERRFINVDNQKTRFSKMIQLRQISLYWQQLMQQSLYGKTLEQKNIFLKNLIIRKQHRLLTIDGNVLLKKNYVDQSSENNMTDGKNKQYTYHLSTSFKQLYIGANYQQLKQMIQVVEKIKANHQKKSIIKMKQLDYRQQLKLQSKFKQQFINRFYPKKFIFQSYTKQRKQKSKKQLSQITQSIQLLNNLSKKLLLKWTKQSVIEIIKKQKQQNRLKQKNKKGWFSFLSTQQTQINLDQNDLKIIQEEIKTLIQLTQEKQVQSFINQFFVQNLIIKITQESSRRLSKNLEKEKNIKVLFFNKQSYISTIQTQII